MNDLHESPPAGSKDELRFEAMTDLSLCAFHCELATGQLHVRGDAASFYNTRAAIAHLKAAIGSLKMLGERNARDAREADERRADHGLRGAERRGERA